MVINKRNSLKELQSLQKKIEKGKYKNFYTNSVLGSNLADIYFIHNNQIFNCTIMSLKGDYIEKVSEIVHDKIQQMYPKYFNFHFESVKDHPGYSEMISDHDYDKKDVRDYEEKIYREICNAKEISVRERIEIDSTYEYGIGFCVYLDIDTINLKTCQRVIKMTHDLPVLYDGQIYLSEPKWFKYKDCLKHKLVGCGLDTKDLD